ncbi:MAG: RNA 2',3'-cyclic phosphodiesterase [Nocardioidaceae bacterium]|nr:RNA 2',3'-cyclic phosphodiesterase [Nocardioidaceae bacterium]
MGTGRRRIFAALVLPPDVEAHLDQAIDGLRTAHAELRWVPSQRWHLTLEFLGECGPHEVDRQLRRWERRAARGWPLELKLKGAGAFPHTWMARVLWTGIDGDLVGWRKVAAYDQQAHVTVARARERTELTAVVDELSSYAGPSWTATELALVESHLRSRGERGPRYEPLETFELGG